MDLNPLYFRYVTLRYKDKKIHDAIHREIHVKYCVKFIGHVISNYNGVC